jgi:endogenous inhibitor of DNA gyrase (YacG/DUF329 family)
VNAVIRRCPGCGRQYTVPDKHPYRPFCSERCQLIDLGDWLTENHRIKGDPVPDVAPEEDDLP